MSYSFNIPFKVERGESMKTIASKITRNVGTTPPTEWIDEAFATGEFPPSTMLVRKSSFERGVAANLLIIILRKPDGSIAKYGVRRNSGTGGTVLWGQFDTGSQSAYIYQGDEYYVLPIEYADKFE